ncbi:hypothetical protein ACQ4PT_057481 [Festuca glaucescens]
MVYCFCALSLTHMALAAPSRTACAGRTHPSDVYRCPLSLVLYRRRQRWPPRGSNIDASSSSLEKAKATTRFQERCVAAIVARRPCRLGDSSSDRSYLSDSEDELYLSYPVADHAGGGDSKEKSEIADLFDFFSSHAPAEAKVQPPRPPADHPAAAEVADRSVAEAAPSPEMVVPAAESVSCLGCGLAGASQHCAWYRWSTSASASPAAPTRPAGHTARFATAPSIEDSGEEDSRDAPLVIHPYADQTSFLFHYASELTCGLTAAADHKDRLKLPFYSTELTCGLTAAADHKDRLPHAELASRSFCFSFRNYAPHFRSHPGSKTLRLCLLQISKELRPQSGVRSPALLFSTPHPHQNRQKNHVTNLAYRSLYFICCRVFLKGFCARERNTMDNTSGAPTLMPLHLLEEITNDFSDDQKVGAGSYGSVYKGEHKNGETIAVKLLHYIPGLDDEQFEKEYLNLASLQHKNIVRLVGYCHETRREILPFDGKMVFAEMTKRALCFKYMENGSLDKYLSDEFTGHDWCTRYAIIKGICQGLKYLHEELQSPMYHLDIKPANVLLDDNMVPKLADFGLSRLFSGGKT